MENILFRHRTIIVFELVGLKSSTNGKIAGCQQNIALRLIMYVLAFESKSMSK